jgi:hypothetical protein
MDGSKEHPLITAGLDLGDKYSYPSASSTHRAVRWWRKVGCVPPQRPSDDASPQSSLLCA